MKYKIVADSSANMEHLDGIDFASVPLTIQVGNKSYVDNAALDVPDMMRNLREYKGKTSTACPSVGDWYNAFGDADIVVGTSITSGLSGCFNSARLAAKEYTRDNPDKKVFILDSLSTGPEMQLIVEKYAEYIKEGFSFDQLRGSIMSYAKKTRLLFSLERLENFAKNGRVSPAVAKVVGLLGIRVVGRASDEGTLEPTYKVRGEKKALSKLLEYMQELGFQGGKVRISHSYNENAAHNFADMLRQAFPGCDIQIRLNRGLCCYYAEEGGVLVGFEV